MRGLGPTRGAGDRGAALVEFALVLPVLMVLLLGTTSGASAWNQNQSLGQGARVAGRYASTLPLPADVEDMDDWLDDIADRAIAASEGQMATGVEGREVCVAYVDPAGDSADQTVRRLMDASGTRTTHTDPCFEDGQGATDRRVQVVLWRRGSLNTGFYQQTIDLRRQVVYRYEADGGL